MAKNMFLYWGSGSPPCWKAMIALEEKGFSGYPNKMLNFSKKEHKGEEVLKLNPRGQLPTFKDGDLVINESDAICFYLESQYPDKGHRLLPVGKEEKALALQRAFEVANMRSGFMQDMMQYSMSTKEEDRDKKKMEEFYTKAREEIGRWESYLKKNDEGDFLAGKVFTMADVFAFPLFAICVRFGLQLEKFPSLSAYYKRLSERPSIKSTWPPHWSEGPGQSAMSQI
ncbi:hypothetical protein ScPMuIL_008946 [Solemya velum]